MLKLSVTKFIFVLYLLLFILSNLDLNDFFFNINQVSLDVWSMDEGFTLADNESLSDEGIYNMFDPVKDAAKSNAEQQNSTQQGQSKPEGNNQGPSNPEPNQNDSSFYSNNPNGEITDTVKLADYLKSYFQKGGNATFRHAHISVDTGIKPDTNIEMSRIVAHLYKERPYWFSEYGIRSTRIKLYVIDGLKEMNKNYPEGYPL